jgi:hypothetical protein
MGRSMALAEEVVTPEPDQPGPVVAPDKSKPSLRVVGLVVAVYLVLSIGVNWDLWSGGLARSAEGGPDADANIWYFEWAYHSIAHGLNPFYSNAINYPYGLNLLSNTSSLLLGALATPVTALWGPLAAFNLMCTLAFGASALAGYFFVRHWVKNDTIAFLGGLLYGFSPYMVGQGRGHLNLSFVALPPLIFLVADEILIRQTEGRSRRWGLLLGVLLTAQVFVSTEVLASTLVMLVFWVAFSCIVDHSGLRHRLRYAAQSAGWCAGTLLVFASYPIWYATAGPGHITGPIQLVPQAYRSALAGPVAPDSLMWLSGGHITAVADKFASGVSENGSYLGFPLIAFLLIGTILTWRRSTTVRVASLTASTAFILSLGATLTTLGDISTKGHRIPLPERLLSLLPLLSNAVPARFSLFMDLFAALLLGLILQRFWRYLRRRFGSGRPAWRAPLTMTLTVVLILLPLVPAAPFAGVSTESVPAVFTAPGVAATHLGITVVFPYPSTANPQAEVWQAASGLAFTTPGGNFIIPGDTAGHIAFSWDLGYTRHTAVATTLTLLGEGTPLPPTPAVRSAFQKELKAWHVNSLVALPELASNKAQSTAYLNWLMGRPANSSRVGALIWTGLAN